MSLIRFPITWLLLAVLIETAIMVRLGYLGAIPAATLALAVGGDVHARARATRRQRDVAGHRAPAGPGRPS